jgi:hypothetical protein
MDAVQPAAVPPILDVAEDRLGKAINKTSKRLGGNAGAFLYSMAPALHGVDLIAPATVRAWPSDDEYLRELEGTNAARS